MLRRLFTVASALSLLLCVLTVGLWVRSYWHVASTYWISHRLGLWELSVYFGVVRLDNRPEVDDAFHIYWKATQAYYHQCAPLQKQEDDALLYMECHQDFNDAKRQAAEKSWNDAINRINLLGGSPKEPSTAAQELTIPFALPLVVAATGILPTLALLRFTAIRRKRNLEHMGCCPACGYDLRASKDRCPECGTLIPVKEGQAA